MAESFIRYSIVYMGQLLILFVQMKHLEADNFILGGKWRVDRTFSPKLFGGQISKINNKLQIQKLHFARMHGHMTSRKRVKILICIIEAVLVSTNKRETLRSVPKEKEFSPLQ